MDIKVTIVRKVLHGSDSPGVLQQVATVCIDGEEYKVLAPSAAKGDAIEWVRHFKVRQPANDGFEGDYDVPTDDGIGVVIVKAARQELEKASPGIHPDGNHSTAQICLAGHVLHCDGEASEQDVHCTQCGSPCIDRCQRCDEPIRGAVRFQSADTFFRPLFCHRCGRAYPWMAERLTTARQLLNKDEKLTADDRAELFDLLQYVMSNPKSDLTPAKKKLLEVNLGKATAYIREALLDLAAKTAAEMAKGY